MIGHREDESTDTGAAAGSGRSAGSPFDPPLPLAKRLNRNALTVAAVLMGVTVLTAVVLLTPGRDRETASTEPNGRIPAAPSRPAFLDRPAQPTPTPHAPTPRDSESDTGRFTGEARGSRRRGSVGAGSPAADPDAPARERAYRAALLRGAVIGPNAPDRRPPAAPDAGGQIAEPPTGPPPIRTSAAAAATATTTTAADATPTARLAPPAPASPVSARVRPRPLESPFTLSAGTVIPGVLLTAINSDLPGDIVGQVARDVYDSRTQRTLLIPKGAKLVGTYDNRVVASQERLLVAWTRLLLPDGRSLTLPGLALTDAQGQSGAADRVDRHLSRVFGNALLLSAISAGAQLSQPRQGSSFTAPSAGQVAAGALGQQLSSTATELVRRGLDVPPTITIRQGLPFNMLLSRDLILDAAYEPDHPAAADTEPRSQVGVP